MASILHDPNPETGGGGSAPAAPVSVPAPPAVATVTTPAPPTQVTIPADEYRRMLEAQTRFAESERLAKVEAESKENERLIALAQKANAETAFNEQKSSYDKRQAEFESKYARLEASFISDKKEVVIASGIAGIAFLPGGAALAADRLAGRIEAMRDPVTGVLVTRDRITLKPAADAIAEWLNGPEAALLIRAGTTGGAGVQGVQTPAPPPVSPANPPKNLGEAIFAQWRENHPTGGSMTLAGKARKIV